MSPAEVTSPPERRPDGLITLAEDIFDINGPVSSRQERETRCTGGCSAILVAVGLALTRRSVR